MTFKKQQDTENRKWKHQITLSGKHRKRLWTCRKTDYMMMMMMWYGWWWWYVITQKTVI
jgi:hypothetical protein